MKTHIDNTIEETKKEFDQIVQDLCDWNYGTVYKEYDREEEVEVLEEDTKEYAEKLWKLFEQRLTEVQAESKRYADERVRGLLEDNFHFWRECPSCGYASNDYLHCLHDRIQSKCTKCDEILPSFDGYCECEFCITEKDVEIYLNQNTESEEGEL